MGTYNLNKNELAEIIYEALMQAEGDFHGKELDEAFTLVKQQLRKDTLLEGMES